jgi:hypothetical protein
MEPSSEMDVSLTDWKDFFCNWPQKMSRCGVLVTSFNEQIPFEQFFTSDTFLLVQRPAPDSLGVRTVIVPYAEVTALKVTEVVKPATFYSLGFRGPPVTK